LARDDAAARRHQLRAAWLVDGVGDAGVAGKERVNASAKVAK
jgi:hypothetical protein